MTPKQQEILVIAQEECAEVIQEISKVFRFGIDSQHKDGMLHRERLAEEVGDLLCMLELMESHQLVDPLAVQQAKHNKQTKLTKWSKIFDQ